MSSKDMSWRPHSRALACSLPHVVAPSAGRPPIYGSWGPLTSTVTGAFDQYGYGAFDQYGLAAAVDHYGWAAAVEGPRVLSF
jgi:hypothetical protein